MKSEKNQKGELTIGRPTYGNGRELITIELTDSDARVGFVRVEIPYAEFTKCLTGHAYVPCEFVTRGLSNVGKLRERDTIRIPIPSYNYDSRIEVAKAAIDAHLTILNKEYNPPWQTNYYLGAQDSFSRNNGVDMIKVGIHRWVKK